MDSGLRDGGNGREGRSRRWIRRTFADLCCPHPSFALSLLWHSATTHRSSSLPLARLTATSTIAEEFACNGSLVDDVEMGQVIQLQGDQRTKIVEILVAEGISELGRCFGLSAGRLALAEPPLTPSLLPPLPHCVSVP